MKKPPKTSGAKHQVKTTRRGEGVVNSRRRLTSGLIQPQKIIIQKGKAMIGKGSNKLNSGQPRAIKDATKPARQAKKALPAKAVKSPSPARKKRNNELTPEGPTHEDSLRIIDYAIHLMDEGMSAQISALNMMPWHPDEVSELFDRLLYNVRANLFKNTGQERKAAQLMSDMAYRAITALSSTAKYGSTHWSHQAGLAAAKDAHEELERWMRRRVTSSLKAKDRTKQAVGKRTNSHSFIFECKRLIAGAVGWHDISCNGSNRPSKTVRMRFFDRDLPSWRFGSCEEARAPWEDYLLEMLKELARRKSLNAKQLHNNISRLKRVVIPRIWDEADKFRDEFLPDA